MRVNPSRDAPGRLETLLVRVGNRDGLVAAYGDACLPLIETAVRARLADAGIEPPAAPMDRDWLAFPLATLECGGSREAIHAFGHRLVAAIAGDPIDIGGKRAYLQVSMQVAAEPHLPVRGRPLKRLAPAAPQADMRAASEILDTLRAGALALAFQPIVHLGQADDAWLYSEALLRRSGESVCGTCGPAIQAMERLGCIARLDQSVAWTVVRLLEQHPHQCLGCNISAASLHDDMWWDCLLHHLRHAPAVARRLTLELTETSEVADRLSARALLDAIRSTGAHIALDDMGGGYSSFEFLAQVQPDVVKIDRSVLRRCRDEDQSPELLAKLVARCARHGGCVVVEGVERPGDLNLARHAGAHAVQGFLLAAPDAGPAWLRDRSAVVHDSYSRSGPSPPAPSMPESIASCRQ